MRTRIFVAVIITLSLLHSSGELRAEEDSSVKKEIDIAKAIARKIPEEQRISSLKFVRRIEGIFDAMSIYRADTLVEWPPDGATLRKDIDRYNDTIADASGEVPEYLIDYVEGTYQAIKKYYSSHAASIRAASIQDKDAKKYRDSSLQDYGVMGDKKLGLFIFILTKLKDPTIKYK